MTKVLMLFTTVLFMAMTNCLKPVHAHDDEDDAPLPAPAIPGVTSEDRFPNACVDCHLNYVDMNMDTRFSTLLKQWNDQVEPKLLAIAQAAAPEGVTMQGKHPDAAGALEDIPSKCLACHHKDSKTAPPFAIMIHDIHLTGGKRNHFMTKYQGECKHCHKLGSASKGWTVPSGPEK